MIVTDRLLIRPLAEADTSQVRQVWGDPRVMEFCGGVSPEERLHQAVKNCIRCQEEHGFSPFAVCTREDGMLIGMCGLKSLPDPEGAELIYHFLPTVWGHGYATESVRAVLAWAEPNLRIRYVEASFDERNGASRNVLIKTGFNYTEDRWHDDVQRTEPVYRIELRRQDDRSSP